MKTLKDIDYANKRVLLRVDFNVPLDKQGNIADDTRIRESLPTIKALLEKGSSLVLMAHLGKPNGKVVPPLSLFPCAQRLEKLLGKEVFFVKDCIGEEVAKGVAALPKEGILLLENLRFHPAEENPSLDPSFALELAKWGEVYVDDAFGSAHRAHASIFEVPKLFPKKRAAGLLMEKEYIYLNALFSNPKHPFFALIGGAKISSKFGILTALLNKVDALFVGGGMAFTLFKAQSISIGDSLCEDSFLEEAKSFLSQSSNKLYLPEDLIIADQFTENPKIKIISSQKGIPPGWRGMDIGPKTIENWGGELSKASTIFWNGPLGVFEFPQFAAGTQGIAEKLAKLSTTTLATTVVGGGDSLAAIHQLNLTKNFSHLSTGGGACLEFLEFGHLPGIDILNLD